MRNNPKSNFDILNIFLDMQRDTMFSRQLSLDFARVIYSETDSSSYWNYALVKRDLTEAEISKIEEKLISVGRKPMIYFEPKEVGSLEVRLLENGYSFFTADSWMFFDKAVMIDAKDSKHFETVHRVSNESDLTTWLTTADHCYVANDPQNPYGPLGKEYLNLAGRAWKENHAVGKFDYFIAYKDNEPVAVGTLTCKDGVGYISNIASLPSVRGEGYGKLVTLYCVYQARMNGAEEVFLATEEGTYPNSFYKRIGFEARFSGEGYVKG